MGVRFSSISVLALSTACMFATPAAAQATDQAAQPAPAQPAADQSEGVGDIVVTAQRREERLQDVPVSVATISEETLTAVNSGGADIRGLSGRVPSLNIESSFGRTFPRFYIRGLGNTDFDLNASQPVSLVYDDVVLENPILKGFPPFDVDRIEVLRGPQGTLFGRNTPAGIVKFDTMKPGSGNNYAQDQLRFLFDDQRRSGRRRPAQRQGRGPHLRRSGSTATTGSTTSTRRVSTTSKAMTTLPSARRSNSRRPTR